MSNNTVKILIADDQPDILSSAKLLFKSEGIHCDTYSTPAQVLQTLKGQSYDLILLDLNYQTDTTSGTEGLSLISQIREADEQTPIVVMTAWASVEIAVNAMKQGANDFICKPWDVERLLSIVKTQIALKRALMQQSRLQSENDILRDQAKSNLLLESAAMQKVVHTFQQISQSDACVLITGDNGTGKSKLAQLCHDMSNRAQQPFISVNMGGLSESIFESEIFGHEKGAFTGAEQQRIGRFELADGGTLFLDEIANISEKQQATLLRLLETGEFERVGSSKTLTANVRIICATNAQLEESVAQGKFRRDLFYRINVVPVDIPALSERRDEIPALAAHFLMCTKQKYQKVNLQLSDAAVQNLLGYAWPGNVRELEHCIERAVLLATGEKIEPENLGLPNNKVNLELTQGEGLSETDFETQFETQLKNYSLAEIEHKMLELSLITYLRKPDEAAKALGVSRSAFYRKLAKYGFDLT